MLHFQLIIVATSVLCWKGPTSTPAQRNRLLPARAFFASTGQIILPIRLPFRQKSDCMASCCIGRT